MKSFLYALVAILYLQFAQLNAQNMVPNGSFEDWEDQEPINWTYRFHYAGFQNVFQSNDAREGSSSAELKSLLFQFLEDYPSANLLSDTFDITGRPEMLEGYYKGTLVGSDSLIVDVTIFDDTEIIGLGKFESTAGKEDWTAFSLTITYTDETAESKKCAISILVGQVYEFSVEGNMIKVDDLRFSNSTNLIPHPAVKPSIYPNPTSDFVSAHFKLPDSENLIFDVITIQGKVVKSLETFAAQGSNTVNINVKDLEPGLYFIQMKGGSNIFSQKIIVE